MRYSWYTHPDPLDTETADELLARYATRNIRAQKTLAADPRKWLVSALLPRGRREPGEDRSYRKNGLWSYICH